MSIELDPIYLLLFLGGVLLGAIYCILLWQSLQTFSKADRPVYQILKSAAMRLIVLGAGFYGAVHYGDWKGLLMCFAGFLIVRTGVIFFIKRRVVQKSAMQNKSIKAKVSKGKKHAPKRR